MLFEFIITAGRNVWAGGSEMQHHFFVPPI